MISNSKKLLFVEWRGDGKMIDHCMKSSKYVKIADMIVGVCSAKPTITKTIYFDDTRKSPGAGFDTFFALNERQNMPEELKLEKCGFRDLEYLCFTPAFWNNRSENKLASLAYASEPITSPAIRKVTADELEVINAAIREVREDYTNRLKAYYKKI